MKPENGIRYDSATVELEGLIEDEAVLRCPLVLARVGVFPYTHSDGRIVREAKLPEELFSPETLASIPGRPITKNHPPISDNDGLINDTNYSLYAKGSLGDSVKVKGDGIWVNETIWDAKLKDSLKRRDKVQISSGFRSKLDWTPGTFRGQQYDVVQRDIRFNHAAHVDKGRAGDSVRVYLDHADFPEDINFAVIATDENQTGENMSEKRDLIKEFRNFLKNLGVARNDSEPSTATTEPAPEPIDKGKQSPSQEQEQNKTKDDLIKSLTAQVATLTDALAEMKKLLASAMAPATQDSIAQSRIKLIETVKSIKPDATTDGVSARDLKTLVIKETLPSAKLDSIDDQELDIRYESAVELAREKASVRGGSNNQEQQKPTPRQDADDLKKIQEARLKMNKRGDK
ncbi:DUF2213 domain-containing protein [Leptospira noguchii]|uniref:PF09979 family protein n=1 Tax=Leptospira noguchii serovar Panama str. CZ214 TaxID=1001595 RepID=T0FGP7_9LEPT|nr:DUF2213 domain-containing protein [Leptospira noguchii]EQA70061.1 PF09979 family protein [Leptospira noguchii serovar Panama str. CZ214]EQA70445.1 PF09979 family protein [Leptospira noguchii serovar Panama str. CZ214]EQA72282.1 PF09979 family protein [Leptospira noguchii serovar Panama str. CZ214]EQA72483.1 PF09979 family protein [Leptospira noguchii serovar Panama str. CZ214]